MLKTEKCREKTQKNNDTREDLVMADMRTQIIHFPMSECNESPKVLWLCN